MQRARHFAPIIRAPPTPPPPQPAAWSGLLLLILAGAEARSTPRFRWGKRTPECPDSRQCPACTLREKTIPEETAFGWSGQGWSPLLVREDTPSEETPNGNQKHSTEPKTTPLKNKTGNGKEKENGAEGQGRGEWSRRRKTRRMEQEEKENGEWSRRRWIRRLEQTEKEHSLGVKEKDTENGAEGEEGALTKCASFGRLSTSSTYLRSQLGRQLTVDMTARVRVAALKQALGRSTGHDGRGCSERSYSCTRDYP